MIGLVCIDLKALGMVGIWSSLDQKFPDFLGPEGGGRGAKTEVIHKNYFISLTYFFVFS